MAAMASMMLKSAALPNCKATQGSSMGHISRVPLKGLRVKCMAEGGFGAERGVPNNRLSISFYFGSALTNSSEKLHCSNHSKKVSTKFGDVFAFSGPAPETINGRLAMVGFVSAVAVELASGEDLISQLSSGGVSWFVLSVVMLSMASLVPMFKGVSAESK